MRIAVTYGPMCLMRSAEETWNDPRTGSEIGWRRICEGLAALGHDVHSSYHEGEYDAAVSINEPDSLRQFDGTHKLRAPLRICMFWLNEFSFCKEGFDEHVDLYFSPSEAHRQKAIGDWGAPKPDKWGVNYLGCDPPKSGDGSDSTAASEPGALQANRVHGRLVYCSSPDRGLHRVLEQWPAIKARVPDATLRIFYRLDPWLRAFDETPYFPPIERNRTRALYIEEALKRMSGPEWGITVVDSVSHEEVLSEMRQAELLLHPCETISWSEGFSCTVADACASGAVPIITDCDALGEVYRELDPVPVGQWGEWRDRVVRALTDPAHRAQYAEKATALAARLTWDAHVKRLNEAIHEKMGQ